MGGLFGGARIAFVGLPPAPVPAIDYRPAIASESLVLQLCAVACFAAAAVLAYEPGAGRAVRRIFPAGVFAGSLYCAGMAAFSIGSPGRGWTTLPFLYCVIPVQLPGGYFLFWLRLAGLGAGLLAAVCLARGKPRGYGPAEAAIGIATGSLALVLASVIRAALR